MGTGQGLWGGIINGQGLGHQSLSEVRGGGVYKLRTGIKT